VADFEVNVSWPAGKIAALWQMSPEITAFHVRDAFGAIMGKFRRELLQPHRGTPFEHLVSRSVHYRVFPKDVTSMQGKRQRIRGQVLAAGRARLGGINLSDIHFRIWSTSDVTLAFERGQTITSSKGMTVPVGEYRSAIDALRRGRLVGRGRKAQHQALRREFLPDKRVFKRGRLLLRRNEDGTVTPAAVIANTVRLPALLGFFATWNRLASARAASFQKAAERIVADIAVGVSRLKGTDTRLNVFRNRMGSRTPYVRRSA
jgi:hypothetical protein